MLVVHQPAHRVARHALCHATIGAAQTVACHRGVRAVDRQRPIDKRQVVVAVRGAAAHRVGVGAGVGRGSTRGENRAQHPGLLIVHQPAHRVARHALAQSTISTSLAIARHRGVRAVDRECAIDKRQVVVAIRAASHRLVGARVRAAATCRHAREHRRRLAIDQTRGGKAAHALAQTVVGHRAAVGRHRGVGLVDRQRAIDKRQVVVAVRAASHRRVRARVRAAAACRHAREHRGCLAIDQTRGGKAAHALAQAVVRHRAAVGRHRGVRLVDRECAIDKRQVVVAVRAGSHRRVRACVPAAAACRHTREHRRRLAIDQTRGGKAAHALAQTVVGHRAAVGRHRGVRLVDRQRAIHKRQVVVAVRAGSLRRVRARVRAVAACRHAREHCRRLTIDQARGGKAAHALAQAVVRHRAAVGRHRGVRLVDRECAIHKRQVVVAVRAGSHRRVRACVPAAAACRHTREHRRRLAIDQTRGGKAAHALAQAVVRHRAAVGRHRGVCLVDRQRAIDKRQVVVAVRAGSHRRVRACVRAATACRHAREHRRRLAIDQARGGKAAHALAQAVVRHCVAVGGHRGVGLVDRQRAIDERQVVVAVRGAAAHRVDVGAGARRGGARGGDRAQHRGLLVVHQPAHRVARHALCHATVGTALAVARHRGVRAVDRECPIHKCQVVVAVRAVGLGHVGARVLAAAACRHTREHRRRLAIDQARGGKAAHALAQTVVGHRAAVGRHRGVGLVDRQRAIDKRQVVVAVRAASHRRVRARVRAAAACRHAREHRGCLAIDQTRGGKAAHALAQTVVRHRAAFGGHRGACLVHRQRAISQSHVVTECSQIGFNQSISTRIDVPATGILAVTDAVTDHITVYHTRDGAGQGRQRITIRDGLISHDPRHGGTLSINRVDAAPQSARVVRDTSI